MRPAQSRVPGRGGRLAGPAFEHEFAGRGVLARVAAGEGVQLQGLSSVRVCFAEGHPVRQVFEIGSVEVHLELVAALRMEGWFDVGSGDGRVDVHDEHGAVAAGKDVQVVDEELAGLACQWRVKVMRHQIIHSFRVGTR